MKWRPGEPALIHLQYEYNRWNRIVIFGKGTRDADRCETFAWWMTNRKGIPTRWVNEGPYWSTWHFEVQDCPQLTQELFNC